MVRTTLALMACLALSACTPEVIPTGSASPDADASQIGNPTPTGPGPSQTSGAAAELRTIFAGLRMAEVPSTSGVAAALEPGTVLRVMVNGLELRDGPSAAGSVVATLRAGETVGAIGGQPVEAGGQSWYEVRQGPGARTGWVASGAGRDLLAVVRNGRIAFSGLARGILSVNPDGSGAVTLLDPQPMAVAPTWSPDGTHLVLVVGDTEARIILMSSDGGGQVDVGPGWQPEWSPDGTRLAYVAAPDFALTLLDASGDRSALLLAGALPRWAPDGRRLAFLTFDCPSCEPSLFVFALPAGAAELLTAGGVPSARCGRRTAR